jgi:uncharacterized protein (DUF1697 family)
MVTYIAILRGINVGGKRIIKMDALKQLFLNLGFLNIETYIQSGNVIFKSKKQKEDTLANIISAEIKKVFTYDVPTIVKNIDDLKKIIASNPLTKDKSNLVEFLHVTLLATTPTKENIENLIKLKFGDDMFSIIDNAVYLYCPNGYSKTKLTNSFLENKLKVTATTRNWKTCNELLNISNIA